MADEIDQMFKWLSREHVGCRFAMHLTRGDNRNRWKSICGNQPKTNSDVDLLESTLSEACTESTDAVIVIFKDTELLQDLTDLIRILCEHSSWTCHEEKFPAPTLAGRNRVGLGLRWKMPNNAQSFVLGFGPFGFLPPTRRAPYTALTLPVCSVGEFRGGDTENERHLCDMANEAFNTREKWDGVWKSTTQLKAELIEEHDSDAAKAKVTFSLPESIRHYLPLS